MSSITDELVAYLSDHKSEPMALFHTAPLRKAIGILDDGRIDPKKQDFDDYPALSAFLFYGRASYPIDGKSLNEFLPMCFIFKQSVVNITKAYVFDSGAYLNKRYHSVLTGNEKLDDFALIPDYEYISRFIGLFFTNKAAYRKGRFNDIDLNLSDFTLASYKRIVNIEDSSVDHRKSTVELVSEESIKLKDHIIGIIIPDEFQNDPKMNHIKMAGIKYECYDVIEGCKPTYYFSEIYSKACRLAEELGL